MQQTTRINISNFSYLECDKIGQGYKSAVYKGRNNNTGEIVAIKVCDTSKYNDIELKLLHQEIRALKLMDSQYIIKLIGCVQNKLEVFLILEYCNQGDLEKLIQQKGYFQEREGVQLFMFILEGFKEQISKGIIHRDIKPSNILLNNGIPKIADYGFSKMDGEKESIYYNVGTTLYMSPEALTANRYSEKSDIWSLGVLLYQMLQGRLPWTAETEKEFIKIITTTPVTFAKSVFLSSAVKDLILKSLAINPEIRISSSIIMDHPLFLNKSGSNSFHIKRSATFYQQKMKSSLNIKKELSPRNNQNSKSINPLEFLQNDLILQNNFYLLKIILRIAKIIDHFDFFNSNCLQEKILYFIIKHALFKCKQFKILLTNNVNSFGLNNFIQYIKHHNIKKTYNEELAVLTSQFEKSFDKLFSRVLTNVQVSQKLMEDAKFQAVFDRSDLEVLSHYILMQPYLKTAIFQLQHQLNHSLMHNTDFQSLEPIQEAGIILFQYLLMYQTACNHITQNFDKLQMISFQFKQFVEAKPTSINKCKFREICQQIKML